ncbi:MAG TPA: hypothetical protein VMY59_08825 [Candidatus Thermoplasmatota archaeon]|nr:hypothetical protein [Candidatus Thermoplasmatota archaeon]
MVELCIDGSIITKELCEGCRLLCSKKNQYVEGLKNEVTNKEEIF